MGRLNYILTAQPSINDAGARPARTDGPKPSGTASRCEIEFRGLTFAYPTTRNGNAKDRPEAAGAPVLRDIDLRVPAGSTLAIVGPTGSGKTTLAALVARLWEAPEGTLLLDGRSIREWPLEQLRRSEEHTSELQSLAYLVCRLLLEKKKNIKLHHS